MESCKQFWAFHIGKDRKGQVTKQKRPIERWSCRELRRHVMSMIIEGNPHSLRIVNISELLVWNLAGRLGLHELTHSAIQTHTGNIRI